MDHSYLYSQAVKFLNENTEFVFFEVWRINLPFFEMAANFYGYELFVNHYKCYTSDFQLEGRDHQRDREPLLEVWRVDLLRI